MLGIEELKRRIEVSGTAVTCPVNGCNHVVERQRGEFKKDDRFLCPVHHIYISAGTFVYAHETDNMLWTDNEDMNLWAKILKIKRESRMAHDNSEDAVTWNVFRFLQRNDLLLSYLRHFCSSCSSIEDVVYWSHSHSINGAWDLLNTARSEFGEASERGSEPDIIVVTDAAIFFIEAKLTAGNDTVPSSEGRKKYETGGGGWFRQVFCSDFETIAVRQRKYELMRFWLLGTWVAHQKGKEFCLLNLVLMERERDIQERFTPLIRGDAGRTFRRTEWEFVHSLFLGDGDKNRDREIMGRYFKNKTLGYSNGKLIPAFSI